jgi:hypothetical protein
VKGFFERLYGLAGSKTMQQERFFTEVLAFLLQSDKALCDRLMNHILQMAVPLSGFEVEAHQQIGGYEVDMIATNEDTVVVFENKIGSSAGRGQLCNYYRTLKKYQNAKTAYLVFVTMDRPNKQDSREVARVRELGRDGGWNKDIQFRHIHWGVVWDVLHDSREPVSGPGGQSDLLIHVLEYMDSMGMASFDRFSPEDYWAWPRHVVLTQKIEKVLKDAELLEHLSKHYKPRLSAELKSGWYGLYLKNKKGSNRIWLGFGVGEDASGVLVYFMVSKPYVANKAKLVKMGYSDDPNWMSLSRPLVEVAPPALTPAKQRERILAFFKGCFDDVQENGLVKR